MNVTEHEVLKSVREIVNDVAGVPVEDITPETRFVEDLGIDSLSIIEIMVQAQQDFGVEIPDDRLRDLTTVADVVDYVRLRKR